MADQRRNEIIKIIGSIKKVNEFSEFMKQDAQAFRTMAVARSLEISKMVKQAQKASKKMMMIFGLLPTLKDKDLISKNMVSLTEHFGKVSSFLEDDINAISDIQVTQIVHMKMLCNYARTVKNNLAEVCQGLQAVRKRDFKTIHKEANRYHDSCREFFEPFKSQKEINDYLDM